MGSQASNPCFGASHSPGRPPHRPRLLLSAHCTVFGAVGSRIEQGVDSREQRVANVVRLKTVENEMGFAPTLKV